MAEEADAADEGPSWTAFRRALAAIERSDVKALRELYGQHGEALTNRLLPDGTGTLLHYACRKAKRTCIAFLCEAGADLNAVDGDGETPLFWLATIARFDAHTVEILTAMVQVLGADVDHRDFLGRVALTYAVVRGTVDCVRRRRVEALLRLGADPRLRDYDKKAPVDYLGMCTTGGEWTDALPENEREMRMCRELLQREMDRRDIRDALLLVRAQWVGRVGQLLAHAAATVAGEPSFSSSPPGARRRETLQAGEAPNASSPASASSIVPVERRLVELPCAEVFDLCMEFV